MAQRVTRDVFDKMAGSDGDWCGVPVVKVRLLDPMEIGGKVYAPGNYLPPLDVVDPPERKDAVSG